MTRIVLLIIFIALATPTVLFFISDVEPKTWRPDPISSLTGELAPNAELDNSVLLGEHNLFKPEDIVFDAKGMMYTGLKDGRIVRINPEASDKIEMISNTGGRPLGLAFTQNEQLIVADAEKGLLRVNDDGSTSVLVDSFEGNKLKMVDELTIAANDDIYFTAASQRFLAEDYSLDFLEASATGRVFKYTPSNAETSLLMDNLFFSNGLALNQYNEYLLVVESGRARVLKFHLTGDKKGFTEVFIDALPSIPGNISIDENGIAWLALISPRDWRIEKLAAFPTVRKMLGALPSSMLLPAPGYGIILGIDNTGDIVLNLQSPAYFTGISSVMQRDGYLYMGSILKNAIAVYELPPNARSKVFIQ